MLDVMICDQFYILQGHLYWQEPQIGIDSKGNRETNGQMSARPSTVTRSRELETVLKSNLRHGYNEKVLWIGEGSGRV